METPDIKALLLAELPAVVGVPVLSRRLDPQPGGPAPPGEFVVVVVTGGAGRVQRIAQDVQVTLDSFSTSAGMADRLARRVDAAMYQLPSSRLPVARVEGWTPSESPDPDTGQDRMTATYRLLIKL